MRYIGLKYCLKVVVYYYVKLVYVPDVTAFEYKQVMYYIYIKSNKFQSGVT